MRFKKVLLGLLYFFLLSPMIECKEKEKILFHIKPTCIDDQRLNSKFLSGCQLVNILEWNNNMLNLYRGSIILPENEHAKKFLLLINQLAKINDYEKKEQNKIVRMGLSKNEAASYPNNKNKLCSCNLSLEAEEFFSCSSENNHIEKNNLNEINKKEEEKEKKEINKKKGRGFLGRQLLSDNTEDNLNKVLQDIATLLEAINQKGMGGVDQNVSNLVNKLTETIDVVNKDVLDELKQCAEEIKNLASGVNQTQAELIHKTIPEIINRIENISDKYIHALNENFLINKLKLLTYKNVTIAIAALSSIYPFWCIFRFYLNNEESEEGHITKVWLWTRPALTIFFPLIIGYLCDIITSANSNLSDFIQYNFLFIEYKKNNNHIIKQILSFEALVLLTSLVLLYKNFDWIQKHTILPEVILSYFFFMYTMIGYGTSNWKRHCGVFFCLYAMLIVYKLYQAPERDINLLKGYTHEIFYKNILFNFLALLKWNSRILITGVAPFGLHAFFNFLRDKINGYIKQSLEEYQNLLQEYNFAGWSNTHNKKYQSQIKLANNRENLENPELVKEEMIERMSKEDIINKIIQAYTIKIKVGDSEELQWINEDHAEGGVLEKLKNQGLIYYYDQEIKNKNKILSQNTRSDYEEKIKKLQELLPNSEGGKLLPRSHSAMSFYTVSQHEERASHREKFD